LSHLKYRKNNKPKVYEIFTKGLSEINLPEDLIRNPEQLQLFKTHVYEKHRTRRKNHPKKKNIRRSREGLENYSGKLTFKRLDIAMFKN
jgi:hypothetical protein